MVATYEENIAKLKQHENWWRITDSQRIILDGIAKGMQPIDAVKYAYPNLKSTKQAVTTTKSFLSTIGIQKLLATIGVDVSTPKLNKDDAVKILTKDFWRTSDPEVRMKLVSLIAKLESWGKDEDPTDSEINMDKLVAAMEKKRRQR